MKKGVVFLDQIYDVVMQNPRWYDFSERTRIPEYRQRAKEVVDDVPEQPGLYLWGTYNRRHYWQSIYFGLAGLGGELYCLHSRLLEELMDEKACFWRICRGEKRIVNARENGRTARARAARKAGATHIMWVATPSLEREQVRHVEAELIEAFNPTANLVRPAPPHDIRRSATVIYDAFRQVIHSNRNTANPVTLK